jgi:competence protein ComFB
MEIHNLLEELVTERLRDICREDESRAEQLYCTSPECRVDALCYVLNRMPARYVSSGRGYAHLIEDLNRDQQLQIDLTRLIHEGLTRVSAVTRNYYGKPPGEVPPGPCFNFPTLQGRVLEGSRFVPLSGVTVTLFGGDLPTPMFDNRWSNPYFISEHTAGLYNFWPASLPAEAPGEERTFEFRINLEYPGFTPLTHHFSLEITSQESADDMVSLQRDHHLPDLYLF